MPNTILSTLPTVTHLIIIMTLLIANSPLIQESKLSTQKLGNSSDMIMRQIQDPHPGISALESALLASALDSPERYNCAPGVYICYIFNPNINSEKTKIIYNKETKVN